LHGIDGQQWNIASRQREWAGQRRVNEIFISWAAPDRITVDKIIDRMDDAGLPVNEYSRKMRAGQDIRQWIVQSIEAARIVLAVVSAKSLREHADWIETEITLAVGRLDRADNKLGTLVLVRIGDIPDNLLPGQLQADRVRFFDLAPDPDEDQLEKLVNDLSGALGSSAPFVVPAAIYAMNGAEFEELRDSHLDHEKLDSLAALCRRLGMPDNPLLWEELGRRYGATSWDFAPYGDGRRLIGVAQEVLRDANRQRSTALGGKPLYLRWYSRAELQAPAVRDRWAQDHSVLIVDAVSALHPGVAAALQNLPKPQDLGKAAVICLPPYTRHTGDLERLIEQSLKTSMALYDDFRAWRDKRERTGLAFDIPTETSLVRWFGQLLYALSTERSPAPDNVDRMTGRQAQPSAPSLSGMPGAWT
jgi:TIR domain